MATVSITEMTFCYAQKNMQKWLLIIIVWKLPSAYLCKGNENWK